VAVTYFGYCNSDGTPLAGSTDGNNDDTIVFWMAATAPGTGSLDVVEFNFFGHRRDAGNATLRMAIYDSAGTTLIKQSTTFVVSNGSPDAWQAGDTTLYPGILTGGTTYNLSFTIGSAAGINSTHAKLLGPTNLFAKLSTDYTGGYPAALPTTPDTNNAMYTFRIGTQPASVFLPDSWLSYSVMPPKPLRPWRDQGMVAHTQIPIADPRIPQGFPVHPSGYYRRTRLLSS